MSELVVGDFVLKLAVTIEIIIAGNIPGQRKIRNLLNGQSRMRTLFIKWGSRSSLYTSGRWQK